MPTHNEHKTAELVSALDEILPRFGWADISTGGGCSAIWGLHPKTLRAIMITDGQANSPESFAEDAIAIYWEDESMEDGWKEKPWTEPQPFFQLLSELFADVQKWNEERTPTEALLDRLSEWADDFEKGIYYHSHEDHLKTHPLAEDIRTAVSLINTHTKES